MRKLITGFATSIDGFIEGPKGEIDWIIYDKEHFKELAEQWKRIDTMFHGRKTYEASLKMQKGSTGKQANPFAHMKHYVFSRTLKKVEDKFILINADLKTEVERIKKEPGGEIAVFGGAELVSSLLNLDLVDELSLAICPVLLGKGKAFFPKIENRMNWNVKEVKTYSSGLIAITYQRK
ncbi:MAG TPA: dihydrofolate reductase family protein [Chitinophagaceae bacterium]